MPSFFSNSTNYFTLSLFARFNVLANYFLSDQAKILPPRIITFRFTSNDPEQYLYSGLDGFYTRRRITPNEQDSFIVLKDFKRLVDYAHMSNSELFLWGEAPSLNYDFYAYLDYMSLKKVYSRLLLIGGVSEELLPFLERGYLRELIFSFDSVPSQKFAKNNAGSAELFRSSNIALDFLYKHRHSKRTNYRVALAVILTPENVCFLDEFASFAERYGVDRIYFFHSNSVLRSHGANHAAKFYDLFNQESNSWRRRVDDYNNIEIPVLLSQLHLLEKHKHNIKYSFVPNLKLWQLKHYYQDYSFTSGYNRCFVPWFMMNVLLNGDLTACANYPDYKIGNLAENSAQELWNCENMVAFRTELSINHRLPICTRCSCLYI